MNLHRALIHEWSDVPVDQQNYWQRLARRTGGFVTPANLISVVGLVLTITGVLMLVLSIVPGIALVIIGRFADLLDGYLADKTGTKSPVGEGFDAVCDKIGTIFVLVAFIIAGLLPWFVIAAVLIHNVASIIVFSAARLKSRRLHPTRAGKVSTALEWIGVTLIATAFSANTSLNQQYGSITILAAALVGVSLMLGLYATGQYIQQYQSQRSKQA